MSFKTECCLLYAFVATIGAFFALIALIVFADDAVLGSFTGIMALATFAMNHAMYLKAKVMF